MRAKQDDLHEPRRPITGLECEHYRETDGERDTSFSEAARSTDLCRLKINTLASWDNVWQRSKESSHQFSVNKIQSKQFLSYWVSILKVSQTFETRDQNKVDHVHANFVFQHLL